MIDIHLHCLPGLDDGPGTIDEAAAICRLAAADGSDTLIATPHQRVGSWWNCDPGRLEALRRELQRRVGATPRILLGAEVRIDRDLIEDLDSDDQGGILTLAGTDYVLLEYSRSGPFVDAEDLVHELTLQGRRPVFAHPEFTPGLGDDLDLMRRLISMGAYFQTTAMSVQGDFGKRTRLLSEAMLDADLIHFVASDGHNLHRRPPGLTVAATVIAERWGAETAMRLTRGNAALLLENQPLPSTKVSFSAAPACM